MASPNMTRADVCRLLGRVAFGATAADIDEWTGKPYVDLVDRLLLAPTAAHYDERGHAQSAIPFFTFSGGDSADDVRMWWLERMKMTPFPLVERMTLFWHGHFATAIRQPYPSEMQVVNQVQTLRLNALGNFRTMTELMTVDPAMLYWLNGNENRVPQPNENYARELFELFTLGKRPQVYTERDIREAARALTGWWVPPLADVTPVFDPSRHDSKPKRILGQTVNDEGPQEFKKVIEIALAQPAAPRFVAFKMVQEFAYTPTSRNLATRPDPLVSKVAATLKSGDWDVAKAMRTLMLADEFRFGSPLKGQQRVRQPVEQLVAAGKALGVTVGDARYLEPMQRMGQRLFDPPNVGGWPVGDGWLSPVTALGRYDLALALQSGIFSPSLGGSLSSLSLPKSDDLDGWAKRLGLPRLSSVTEAAIKSYLAKRPKDSEQSKAGGVLALILSSPEWVVM